MRQRLSVLFFLALAITVVSVPATMPASKAAGDLTGILFCLDPGHGGSDPGAVNEAYGLWESEINLDVAYALKALLENDGADVVMTRVDDSYRSNRDRYTFCNEQKATLLISVHTNSVTDPLRDGAMTLYFHDDDKALAGAIHEVLYPALQATAPDPATFDDLGLYHFASGVLLKSDMPAAMMEPLFMSNPAEAALLVQRITDGCGDLSCRRGQIARAVHEGILHYLGSIEPMPTPEPGGSLHVAAIEMSFEQKGPNVFVYTWVTVHDQDGAVVPGAAVTVTVTQPDGTEVLSAGTTAEDGTATFKLRSGQSGTYEARVTDVSKEGWTYDPAANVEMPVSLTVP